MIIGDHDDKFKPLDLIKQKKVCSTLFCLEILALLIMPIPIYDRYIEGETFSTKRGEVHIVYYLSDILFSLMFVRLFFIFRTLANYSVYTDPYSKTVCRKYGFNSSVRFAMKCYLINHPEWSFMIIFGTSIWLLSYILRIFEIVYQREIIEDKLNHSDLGNAVWIIFMTIFTVGYGDMVPHTTFGKVVASISAIWGAVLVSICVVTISNIFSLSHQQTKAHKHIILNRSAATIIT